MFNTDRILIVPNVLMLNPKRVFFFAGTKKDIHNAYALTTKIYQKYKVVINLCKIFFSRFHCNEQKSNTC